MKKKSEFVRWFGPLLDALRDLGGSGSPQEVSRHIATTLKLPESILDETIKNGASKYHNQVCWARQYLVWEGYVESSRRGIWTLTPSGEKKKLEEDEARAIFLKWVQINAEKRKREENAADRSAEEIDEEEIDDDTSITIDYRQRVLEFLRSMSPRNFEKFCLLLLRENDFDNLKLTGGSHDEGIDGIAILRINPFVSFRVIFQAKRYQQGKNISRAQIGDFRNAMLGRADKGIFITTSKFTQEAEREANREGAPPIELVDCDQLVKMIEKTGLGLRPVTTYEIDREFFIPYLES